MSDVRAAIAASIEVKQALLDDEFVALTERVAELMTASLREGGKVLFCGNGGSAADATHLAAELVGRFQLDRAPLAALSLSDNISSVTAIGNDYEYAQTFSRQLRGLASRGDVLVALSTSGGSANVLEAARAAAELGVRTVGFTGAGGGELASLVEVSVRIPSDSTARIQEGYMLLCHTACELVERALFAS
ncbi:MAG TPA: SIS domain-containing protein [Solirubrobacteraceae bacterium]|nr:SIS domain-containing protein [Solirubrobacteraceae bacterium]